MRREQVFPPVVRHETLPIVKNKREQVAPPVVRHATLQVAKNKREQLAPPMLQTQREANFKGS
jgi:hypothetical protein